MGADINKDYRGILGLNNLFRRLSGKRFTAVADFHDVLRTKYLRLKFWFDHIPTAHINKHREGKKALTAKHNKRFEQQPTSFQNYADVLKELGYPVQLTFKSLFRRHQFTAQHPAKQHCWGSKQGASKHRYSPFRSTSRQDLSPLKRCKRWSMN